MPRAGIAIHHRNHHINHRHRLTLHLEQFLGSSHVSKFPDGWELYDIAAKEPARVKARAAAYDAWAKRANVVAWPANPENPANGGKAGKQKAAVSGTE